AFCRRAGRLQSMTRCAAFCRRPMTHSVVTHPAIDQEIEQAMKEHIGLRLTVWAAFIGTLLANTFLIRWVVAASAAVFTNSQQAACMRRPALPWRQLGRLAVVNRRYHNLAPFVRQIGERKAQTCAKAISRQLNILNA